MRGTAFFKVTFLPLLSLILSKLNHVSFSPLLVPTSSTLKAWSEIIKKNKKKNNSTHAHTHMLQCKIWRQTSCCPSRFLTAPFISSTILHQKSSPQVWMFKNMCGSPHPRRPGFWGHALGVVLGWNAHRHKRRGWQVPAGRAAAASWRRGLKFLEPLTAAAARLSGSLAQRPPERRIRVNIYN